MERNFHNARRTVEALERRQKLWQDGVSQDAETRLEAQVGHRVDPLDCLDDREIMIAMDVAVALQAVHAALSTATELFSRIEQPPASVLTEFPLFHEPGDGQMAVTGFVHVGALMTDAVRRVPPASP
jgi:hypothetical protein